MGSQQWLVTDVQRDRLPKMNLRSFIILAPSGKTVLLTLSLKLACSAQVIFSHSSSSPEPLRLGAQAREET